jgi:hypothetical protein
MVGQDHRVPGGPRSGARLGQIAAKIRAGQQRVQPDRQLFNIFNRTNFGIGGTPPRPNVLDLTRFGVPGRAPERAWGRSRRRSTSDMA